MSTLKKILINVVAVLMVIMCCFSFAGCQEDITQIKLNVSVYNYEKNEEEVVVGFEDVTLTIDLYGHFAPKTVENVLKYVKQGYYNNTAFYKLSSYTNQIMLGDYLVDGATIKAQEEIMPTVKGEFEHGGVSGSNLIAKKGAIGLWRTWYSYDNSYNTSNDSMNSGRATWFIPTNDQDATLSGYKGWFCIFAQMDMENEDNAHAIELIQEALLAANTTTYVVYYTGEYDAEQADNNHGLTKHIVPADDFVLSEVPDIFTAKDDQEVCYNRHDITVPTVDVDGETKIAAYVKTATVA